MKWTTRTARRIADDYGKGGGTTGAYVAKWLSDSCDIIDALLAQKKAAAERVRWVNAGPRHHVAKVGMDVFDATGDSTSGFRLQHRTDTRRVDLGIFHCLDSTGRRIRAYRAGKWPKKGKQ